MTEHEAIKVTEKFINHMGGMNIAQVWSAMTFILHEAMTRTPADQLPGILSQLLAFADEIEQHNTSVH